MTDSIKDNTKQIKKDKIKQINEDIFDQQPYLKILNKPSIISLKPLQINSIKAFKTSNIIVEAPTGTGKTFCFLLPILHSLYNNSLTKALIILPTYELCSQIYSLLPADHTELFVGSTELTKKVYKSKILITTPGKTLQLIKHKYFNEKKYFFDQIDYLILDEADKLLERFKIEMIFIATKMINSKRIGLFSATMATVLKNKKIGALKFDEFKMLKFDDQLPKKEIFNNNTNINYNIDNVNKNNCEIIEIPKNLEIEYLEFNSYKQKLLECIKLIKDTSKDKILVFFNTSFNVDYFFEVFNFLLPEKEILLKLHAKLSQQERNKTFNHLNTLDDKSYILLTTDLAARGLDLKNITTVLHFDFPKEPMNIFHRCGRTARNFEHGQSKILAMKSENCMFNYLKNKLGELKFIQYDNITQYDTNESETDLNKLELFVKENHLKLATKAFISFVSGYKQHILSYLLSFKELNFDSLIEIYFLVKVPSMPELQNIKFEKFEKKKRFFSNKKEKAEFYRKKNKKNK